jgi:hypothetical protein
MFRKLSRKLGKYALVILYAAFAATAAKTALLPLIVLFLLYSVEFTHLDRKAAGDRQPGPLEGLAQFLCIGLSWWLRTA